MNLGAYRQAEPLLLQGLAGVLKQYQAPARVEPAMARVQRFYRLQEGADPAEMVY